LDTLRKIAHAKDIIGSDLQACKL